MDKRQRIALQRQKVREVFGILRGIDELFAAEDDATAGETNDLNRWRTGVDAFEIWIFASSPIA